MQNILQTASIPLGKYDKNDILIFIDAWIFDKFK